MAELINQYEAGERAEQHVIALRQSLGLRPEARPVDVDGFLKRLRKHEGINTKVEALRGLNVEELGSIKAEPDRRPGRTTYVIRLRRMSDARRRFVFAHEVGHLVLHRDSIDELPTDDMAMFKKPLNPENPIDRRETEANAFAAELTMPREVMGRLWRSRVGRDDKSDIRVIAGMLGVSSAMVEFRLHNLGTLDGRRLRPLK